MKKVHLIILLALVSFHLKAQNLVPNPSFEDTVACPTGGSAIDLAIGWSSFGHSPDYFNSCNSTFISTPSNFAGFQHPASGNAYAGLILYYSPGSNLRENIGIQLTQPLITEQRYYASFNIAMGFNLQTQRIGIATNKIGIRLSTVPFTSLSSVPLDNYCQIYSDSIITDTLNWTKISGSFVSDSTYNYLIIGNFFTDSLTSRISYDSSAWYSYYYIDDIRFSTDSNFVNAINENSSSQVINVYPNPAVDWIDVYGTDIHSVIIYDIFGRIVFSKNSEITSHYQIATSSFPKGIHFLTVKTLKSTISKKIILQ